MNSKSRIFDLYCGLVGAVVLYVLSVGPAMKLSGCDLYSQNNAVRTVWAPVLALDNTPARPTYRAYLKLWRVPETFIGCIY